MSESMRQFLKIVLLGIGAAVFYGVIHDQVTVRICREYFTVAHPPVFGTTSPTLLALGWGIIATWWVGAGLGVLLGVCAQAGSAPRMKAFQVVRPVAMLLLGTGILACVAGGAGFFLFQSGQVGIGGWEQRIAPTRQAAFAAAAWMHLASYGMAALGGIGVAIWMLITRRRAARP